MKIGTDLLSVKYRETAMFERAGGGKRARLIALLFCRPDHKLMQSDIVPALPYFHFRSGRNTAFYFAGFEEDYDEFCMELDETDLPKLVEKDESRYATILGPERETWYFVPFRFNSLRKEVESITRWKYSGGCDMLLLNSRSAKGAHGGDWCELDFTTSMVLRLERLTEVGSMPTVSQLFERIFQYAENQDAFNPVWGFSDAAGLSEAKSGVWPMILSLLPEAIRKTANGSRHLIVSNLEAA